MKVNVVGAGPAGLFFALLLKKADASHQVTVHERNRAAETFGWGVVFSDATLGNLAAADPETHQRIVDSFAHWDDIDIHVRDRTITSGGHGFSGIARKTLLRILTERAAALGVELRFGSELDAARVSALAAESDLLVGADGVNSLVRRSYADAFQPELDLRSTRFIWLGTMLPLDAFTFIFLQNEFGIFQVHAYRFDRELSTFIVECDDRCWRAAGFDGMDAAQTVTRCEQWFAPWLQGHALMHNAGHQAQAPWQQFLRVKNAHWFHQNIVLLGDAAHTAHFSIGSGTKLAMEDAIALTRYAAGGMRQAEQTETRDAECEMRNAEQTETRDAECEMRDAEQTETRDAECEMRNAEQTGTTELTGHAELTGLREALRGYQEERGTEALRLQNAARNSMEWFENVGRYIHLEPEQFAYSLLTRSQRVSHENLRLRDRPYLEDVERWFAGTASQTTVDRAAPPAFTPYRLRGLELSNRIVVSPMDMYSAVEGTPNDFHLVHLGARALGGAGLVFTEMTCVSPEGRITPGCTGMYALEHEEAWQRVTRFVHEAAPAKICLQLGHSGRKGSTRLMWEGMDEPLAAGNWPVIGPSALPYSPRNQAPREMSRADLDTVRDQFVRATEMALDCDFDMIELHSAHGYLLSSFLTPLSNARTDEYGGSLENRLRYPLEVFCAMRAVWPPERPMSVRISATDWVPGGLTGQDSVLIARAFVEAGADIIHVSTGQTSSESRPVYGRMFQTPFSDWIRNEARVPTIAVGNITDIDQVNSIIAAGRADLVSLGRPHLSDPNWTLRAAAQLGWRDQPWPSQYQSGKQQLERLLQRDAETRKALDG